MRLYCLLALFLLSCTSFSQNFNIIPRPVSVTAKTGRFTLSANTIIVAKDETSKRTAAFLNDYLQQVYGFQLKVAEQGGLGVIKFTTRQFIKAPEKDSYNLSVSNDAVVIEGDTQAGTFYGMQTLLQLLPVPQQGAAPLKSLQVPCVVINDAPRFAYRGLHLDVSRHLFPVAFLKKYIDYIALHKMNYFHWHLTDDQGWRMEIKKYPELTKEGAWRNGTIIGHHPGTGNDNTPYGGFYTQEEVKEIVQYAADRFITVVPEIEMPGHASAAIAAYPWLSCFPEKETEIPHHPSDASKKAKGKKVQETFGVFEDIFCAGKDSTFQFLQDVLDEVVPLFPGNFLHVGGDEAPKDHWRQCPRCQARIKAEGLKDEHGLQSYFIQRMEKYLNSKGKTLIGWDEILEGGLAPNAVVMSWRGEKGGIDAARENHTVIMTPGSHVYLDHSQSKNEDSLTIGGFSPIEKVYSYEPVPKELPADKARYILGAQGNVWTEYMQYPSKVEYMIFPRLSALSEVLWSPKAVRNWSDFERRQQTQFLRYQHWGAHYSNAYFEVKTSVVPAPGNNGVRVKLESKGKDGKLMYGISGKHFAKNYTAPIQIDESAAITSLYTRNGMVLDSTTLRLKMHKATGKKVSVSVPPAQNYPGDGAFTLVNGVFNEKGMSSANEFIGYNGKPVTVVIDMGKLQPLSEVRLHALSASSSWVHPPKEVTVLLSTDGKKYSRMGTAREFKGYSEQKGSLDVVSENSHARFIKLEIAPLDKIPERLPGAGNLAWMFLDEVEVL